MYKIFISLILFISVFFGIFELDRQEANASSSFGQKVQTPVYTYRIVNVYPHDQRAFTQGLLYNNGVLYESTGGYGQSSLRRVELETGNFLQDPLALDKAYYAEGIALWKNQLIQLTWKEQVGFVYDPETFKKLNNFYYRTEGWGITHDGHHLIMSDGTNTLHFLDPYTFQEIDSIKVYNQENPIEGLNELEYVKGEIWANVLPINDTLPTDHIARISPTTGNVLGWVDLNGLLEPVPELSKEYPPGELNGIASDEVKNRIFVTGKFWPKLFEIELVRNY